LKATAHRSKLILGTNLVQLDLRTLLATKQQPQGQFYESDLRMVSMFLWEQGKFQRFLQLIQQQKKDGYESYFERQLHRFAPTAFLEYKRKSSEPM